MEFSRAIDFFDGNPEYFLNRARACMELGEFDTVYKDLQRCLELNPQCDRASALMQQFNCERKVMFVGKKFVKV